MGVAMNNMPLLSHMIAVTNRRLCTRGFTEQIERICHAKPDRIILREKDLDDKAYEDLLCSVLPICHEYEIPLFVSGRIELSAKYSTPAFIYPTMILWALIKKKLLVSPSILLPRQKMQCEITPPILLPDIFLPLTAKKAYRRVDLIFWKIYATVLRQLAPS